MEFKREETMRLRIILATLTFTLFATAAHAFNSGGVGKLSYSANESFRGAGNGGTGGTTTGGTTTGGTTTGGTTTGGTTTGGTTTGGTTTGGTTTGGTTTGGTTTGGTTTGGTELGCTRTQGYWGSSPAGQARLIVLIGVSGMDLGNVHYTATQIDEILDASVVGNMLKNIAHQLIAAKMNVLNGASDASIAADIVTADSLIGDLVVPPVGSDIVLSSSTLGMQMETVKDRLQDFNQGNLGVPHCND
jgi:hypothetical protein